MSFNKKDYKYDTQEVSSGSDSEKDMDQEVNPSSVVRDREPKAWVRDLLFDLQDIASSKGVSLLDKCTTKSFAEFVGRFEKDAWWY